MTNLMKRSARHFTKIQVARRIKTEIEKVGLDNLKILAENGRSIVGTYLNGCSPKEKATHRRELLTVLAMGITLDMLLSEIARQMPVLSPIMLGKDDYKRSERQELERFLKEG